MAKKKSPTPDNPASADPDDLSAQIHQQPAAETLDGTEAIAEGPSTATRSREDRVREAAYRRFEARGDSGGDAHQDWLDAEAEVARDEGGR